MLKTPLFMTTSLASGSFSYSGTLIPGYSESSRSTGFTRDDNGNPMFGSLSPDSDLIDSVMDDYSGDYLRVYINVTKDKSFFSPLLVDLVIDGKSLPSMLLPLEPFKTTNTIVNWPPYGRLPVVIYNGRLPTKLRYTDKDDKNVYHFVPVTWPVTEDFYNEIYNLMGEGLSGLAFWAYEDESLALDLYPQIGLKEGKAVPISFTTREP